MSGQKNGTRRSTIIHVNNTQQIQKQTEATEQNFEQVQLPAKLLDYFLWSHKSNINLRGRIQSNYSFSFNSAQQLRGNGGGTHCSFPRCLTTSRPVFMHAMPVSEKSFARRNAGAHDWLYIARNPSHCSNHGSIVRPTFEMSTHPHPVSCCRRALKGCSCFRDGDSATAALSSLGANRLTITCSVPILPSYSLTPRCMRRLRLLPMQWPTQLASTSGRQ